MKYIIYFFFVSLITCSYPDIDTVPKFDNLLISDQEKVDLCNLKNTDNMIINECLTNIITQEDQ